MLRCLDKKMKRYINVKLLSILAFFFFSCYAVHMDSQGKREPALSVTSPGEYCGIPTSPQLGSLLTHDVIVKLRSSHGVKVKISINLSARH